MTINNIRKIIPGSFMEKAQKGLTKTGKNGKAVFCHFCNDEKYEFWDPRTEKIKILQCKCEKHYDMLREFLDANVDWIVKPDNLPDNVIKYQDKDNHLRLVQNIRAKYEQMKETREINRARLLETMGGN